MSNEQLVRLNVEGMTCSNCALGIRKYLEKQGLEDVSVSFPNSEAAFKFNGSHVPLNQIVSGIEQLGFKVVDDTEALAEGKSYLFGWSALGWKLFICVLFTIPLLLAMVLPYPILKEPTVQFLLCLPVYLIGAAHFGKSAFHSLRSGILNMDVLIIMGASAAFFYSLAGYALSLGEKYLFWETSATIITLVLLGNLIEHRAVKRTTSAIKELLRLQPDKAKRIKVNELTNEEVLEEVDTKDIRVGERFLVRTGDKIPVDGKVIWGEGAANEAMMTGESLLMDKKEGAEVIGGTILELGTLKVEATHVGKDSALAKIIEMVKNAQNNQPPIHKLADKISAVFVPIVLLIAVITFLVWFYILDSGLQHALLTSVAVLVIACPCAMGLATPTALAVGIGRAARSGILVKGGDTLETFGKADIVVFDKTGTLTTGMFSIDKMKSDLPEQQFKAILLGLEWYSTHPLARSIVRSLEVDSEPLVLSEVQELKGLGVMGKDDYGNTYMVGSYNIAAEFTDEKDHTIYVLKNGQLVGWVDMNDSLRPDASQCVTNLNKNNIKTILLSGDQEDKTEYIARKIGIEKYYANKLPQQKLDIIAELNDKNTTVMVGDGINDAPALTQASIGVSLSSASQVAIEAADVVLLNSNLRSVNEGIGIAKHTIRTVKQNLFWAFIYNIIAIPIAAMGLLNPMIAAAAMALSDVFVIGNSLRLRNKKV